MSFLPKDIMNSSLLISNESESHLQSWERKKNEGKSYSELGDFLSIVRRSSVLFSKSIRAIPATTFTAITASKEVVCGEHDQAFFIVVKINAFF